MSMVVTEKAKDARRVLCGGGSLLNMLKEKKIAVQRRRVREELDEIAAFYNEGKIKDGDMDVVPVTPEEQVGAYAW